MTRSQMLKNAERDSNGDIIWKKRASAMAGGTTTLNVDVGALLTPGERRTHSLEILRIEAELADDGREPQNPALPANDRIAREATKLLDERGLTPAWQLVDRGTNFPDRVVDGG